jgi:integrase
MGIMPRKSAHPLPNSDRAIRALKPPEASTVSYPDQKVPGLVLRITSNDHRSWIVRKRPRGTGRRGRIQTLTLGTYPELLLSQARDLASEAIRRVAQGEDLGAFLRAPAPEVLWGELTRDWLALKEASDLRPPTLRMYRWLVESYLSQLDHLEVSAVSKTHLIKLHERVFKQSPTTSDRLKSLIKAVCRRAVKLGYRDDDPSSDLETLHGKRKKPRPWEDEELVVFWRLTEELLSPLARCLYRLKALWLLREATLLRLRWDMLVPEPGAAPDPQTAIEATCRRGWAQIPGDVMKNGEDYTVPMTPTVAEVLRCWAGFGRELKGWMFPGRRPGQHVSSLSTSAKLLRNGLRDKFPGFDRTPHGLRDSAASYLQDRGTPHNVIQRALGHKQTDITGSYARWTYPEPHREALILWHAHLMGLVSGTGGKLLAFP